MEKLSTVSLNARYPYCMSSFFRNCCRFNCVQSSSFSLAAQSQRYMENFTKTEKELLQFLVWKLKSFITVLEGPLILCQSFSDGERVISYEVDGSPVCRAAFQQAHGITNWKMTKALKIASTSPEGSMTMLDTRKATTSQKKWEARFWLDLCSKNA